MKKIPVLYRLKQFAVYALCAFATSGCLETGVGDNYTTFTGTMMASFLEENESLSLYAEAINKAEAMPLLNSYGKYTLFAPTNDAVREYLNSLDFTTIDQLDEEQLYQLVYYHLLDGDKSGTKSYKTSDSDVFGQGALPTKNMVGRSIYTSLSGGNWTVDKQSRIISSDNIMVNGVVHVVDRVLSGNNDLLPDYIASDERFTLFSQALIETGIADRLYEEEDDSYVKQEDFHWVRPRVNGTNLDSPCSFPKKKLIAYTILAESDSIMKLRENITTLDDLKKYAAKIYPDDPSVAGDYKNPNNSLYRFVAYHILLARVSSNRLVEETAYAYCWSSEYTNWSYDDWQIYKNEDDRNEIRQYWLTMAENTIIDVQLGNVFNDSRNAISSQYKNMLPFYGDAITLISKQSDNECANGIIHSLNNMLIYDNKVESDVLYRRLRMEYRTFMPELYTNDVLFARGQFYAGGVGRAIPGDYCKNFRFNEESTIHAVLFAVNVHPYMYGDDIRIYGFFDMNMVVGPIPAGKYEVRVGYSANKANGGVTQFYFDGLPCGIPLDMSVTSTDAGTGWLNDYNSALMAGQTSSTSDPFTDTDDPDGFENDKSMRNCGYMKGPDSFTGRVFRNDWEAYHYTARNSPYVIRKILGVYSFTETSTHDLRMVQMKDGDALLDYIEFMPVELIETEDIH